MSKTWMAATALLIVLGFAAPTLMADNDKSHGKENPHARSSDQDKQGWERRDGYEYRVYADPSDRPPGWGHGKKTGWGNCGLPPGQAKNTAAAATSTKAVLTTITRTSRDEWSSVARLSRFTAA